MYLLIASAMAFAIVIKSHPVAYNYINNALAEARLFGCLADVVACLSPAYASIDANRQSAPVDHALLASTRHNQTIPRAPKLRRVILTEGIKCH
jgi:hypothetical protein